MLGKNTNKVELKHRRMAEVVQRHEGPSPKSLESGENFKPLHTLFCRDIKICRDLRTFWKSLGKKNAFFWSKTVFLVQEVHYYMIYLAYYTELSLQNCNYAQKQRICCKNSKYALDENLYVLFLPSPKGCQLLPP